MVLLSSMGIACKSLMKTSNFRMRYRWWRMDDEELATDRLRSTNRGWVGIADVRRYQQDTYTSMLRLRRGPRLLRSSSRMNDGRQ
ncbi:hypothetical protein GT037_011245 [Alternaria burnsii]|uniref:Uncharacterized protein n=1 Tax=Alternaria burnsii TaxID=1187904 RepID=A0A8H7EAF7_9PLEO|nr:uncharacterized protein GT037_011245 [Alternaria burnsii]KAF7670666.1 hypothetical protein GT037_011245 [Alternaria burnsii]